MNIKISDKYSLKLLQQVRKDDLNLLFENSRVLYVNNWPDYEWHNKHNLSVEKNYSLDKFLNFFQFFHPNSLVLSPTNIGKRIKTFDYRIGIINHLGSKFSNLKLSLLTKFIKGVIFAVLNKNRYDIILVHNYQFPIFHIGLISNWLLGKKLIIDFEDDYYCLNKSNIQSKLFYNIYRHFNYPIIAINEKMIKYFNDDISFYVFNGFIDLNYSTLINKNDNITFLISGTLNIERGVLIIPQIVNSFRLKFNNFKIIITGELVDFDLLISNYPEIEYLGFVSILEYNKIIESVDYCLVLQLPDHPFNEGSFPSKIENYSKFKKPILILTLNE